MAKNKALIIGIIIVILAIIGFVLFDFIGGPNYDEFAQCLTDEGLIMFGSKTCPHCNAQKEDFGDSFRFIDYVECSIEQDKCAEHEITLLPTWEFKDGNQVTGHLELERLAFLSGCELEI